MKKIALLLLVVSTVANAKWQPLCKPAVNSDSVGRGIEAGFTGVHVSQTHLHQECFNIGFESGKTLKEKNEMFCEDEFNDGYAEGVKASWYGIGSECYNAGYTAGRGALGFAAREGVPFFDQDCTDAYNRGVLANVNGKGPESNSDQRLNICFHTGFADGILK